VHARHVHALDRDARISWHRVQEVRFYEPCDDPSKLSRPCGRNPTSLPVAPSYPTWPPSIRPLQAASAARCLLRCARPTETPRVDCLRLARRTPPPPSSDLVRLGLPYLSTPIRAFPTRSVVPAPTCTERIGRARLYLCLPAPSVSGAPDCVPDTSVRRYPRRTARVVNPQPSD
jgi:hypothetical protein